MYNKCMVRKFLLSGIAVLLILLVADVSYSCGPCCNSDDCGDYSVGTENCSECSPPTCYNCSCRYYCPEGAPWQYCEGLWGSCTESTVPCNEVIKLTCQSMGHGARYCGCSAMGYPVGFYCDRVSCG